MMDASQIVVLDEDEHVRPPSVPLAPLRSSLGLFGIHRYMRICVLNIGWCLGHWRALEGALSLHNFPPTLCLVEPSVPPSPSPPLLLTPQQTLIKYIIFIFSVV